MLFRSKNKKELQEKNIDMHLLSADGYCQLSMYPEAWLAVCRSIAQNYTAEAVALQLKICIQSNKWKLGEQIAHEYINKIGNAPFLAEYFIAQARRDYLNGDLAGAKMSIQRASNNATGEELIALINDPVLKKIYKIHTKS